MMPLRDLVVFPGMTLPLLVGRLPSIHAIEKAVAQDRMLFVTAQTRSEVADPTHEELYPVGTLARVLQLFRLPDGTMRVLVEGLARCRAIRFLWAERLLHGPAGRRRPRPRPPVPNSRRRSGTCSGGSPSTCT